MIRTLAILLAFAAAFVGLGWLAKEVVNANIPTPLIVVCMLLIFSLCMVLVWSATQLLSKPNTNNSPPQNP